MFSVDSRHPLPDFFLESIEYLCMNVCCSSALPFIVINRFFQSYSMLTCTKTFLKVSITCELVLFVVHIDREEMEESNACIQTHTYLSLSLSLSCLDVFVVDVMLARRHALLFLFLSPSCLFLLFLHLTKDERKKEKEKESEWDQLPSPSSLSPLSAFFFLFTSIFDDEFSPIIDTSQTAQSNNQNFVCWWWIYR